MTVTTPFCCLEVYQKNVNRLERTTVQPGSDCSRASLTAYCFRQAGQRQLSNCALNCPSVSIATYSDSHQHPGASFLHPNGFPHFEQFFSRFLLLRLPSNLFNFSEIKKRGKYGIASHQQVYSPGSSPPLTRVTPGFCRIFQGKTHARHGLDPARTQAYYVNCIYVVGERQLHGRQLVMVERPGRLAMKQG